MIFNRRKSPSGLLGKKRKAFPYPPNCDPDNAPLVQYTNYKKTVEADGVTYLKDLTKGRTTGVADGRDYRGGAYFDGDEVRYVDLDETINLGTTHEIEFEAAFSITAGDMNLLGYTTTGAQILLRFLNSSGGVLRYRGDSGASFSYTLPDPTNRHIYKYVKNGTSLKLFIDESEVVEFTIDATVVMLFDLLFERGDLGSQFGGQCSYIKFTYDTDKVVTFTFEESNTDTKVIGYGTDSTITGEIQNATGSDRVSSDAVEGQQDLTGYLIADGVNHYYDEALTELIPAGVYIGACGNGKAGAWTADGQASLDWSGGLRADLECNQGGFTANGSDNYLNTGIIPNEETTMKVWGNFTDITSDVFQIMGQRDSSGVNEYAFGIINDSWRFGWGGGPTGGTADLLPHVFEVENGDLNIDGEEIVSTSSSTSPSYEIYLFGLNQSGNLNGGCLFTIYKAEITHNGETHIWDFNANGDEAIVYTIDGVVQTPPTIQGTVTSGQWSDDGVVRQTTNLYSVSQADKTLTEQWWNHGDEDNLVKNVISFSTLFNTADNNQQFIAEPWVQAFYSAALSGDCLTKVQKFMGF